ncbi:MAG: nitric oxide reductase transcriptional regulator NorR [Oceanobacter sp.]
MTRISTNALIELALDLSRSLNSSDRFERLLTTVRRAIHCDAVVLLVRQGNALKPLAQQGLTDDSLGRRYEIEQHPRFHAICSAQSPVRFPADSRIPDPYDGLLLESEGNLPIHACMGLPLLFENRLIGVLTLDSLQPGEFDDIPERTLEIISAMAAASLNTALTLELLEHNSARAEALVQELTSTLPHQDHVDIIGESTAMQRLKRDIQTVSGSNLTVLIHGETGVGKELVAQSIHQQSHRAEGPLVYLNCAALPENLIESELFGHIRGAFTGANRDRTGKFALANGGTLFLDEVGELPLAVQSKLLRALQNHEIQPVGQDATQTVDVRVIAATNRNLQQEVAEQRFRADLYHRLSVFPIEVPPLRQREQDIALLAGYFLERSRRKLGISQLRLSSDAIHHLTGYDWPGNVRELEHGIDRAALRARSHQRQSAMVTIAPTDLGDLTPETPGAKETSDTHGQAPVANQASVSEPTQQPIPEQSLKTATEAFQRQRILAALTANNGNWAAAARQLEVDRANLSRLAKRLGVEVERKITARNQ